MKRDDTLCSESVSTPGMTFHRLRFCERKRTVVRDGRPYCTQHDPERKKLKEQERRAERDNARSADQKIVNEGTRLARRLRTFADVSTGVQTFYYGLSSLKYNGHRRALVIPFEDVEKILKALGET